MVTEEKGIPPLFLRLIFSILLPQKKKNLANQDSRHALSGHHCTTPQKKSCFRAFLQLFITSKFKCGEYF